MNWKLALFAGTSAFACLLGTANAQQSGTLRMGLEASYPPFESKTSAGKLVGFDVDVGNAICQRMNVKCVWVENTFDGLIPALQAKKFDIINSAMNITDKRKQSIAFTTPVYVVPIQMIAKRSAHLLPNAQSLKGKSVGVLQGSIHEDYARKHWESAGVKIVTYQDQNQIYPDLLNGRIDASVQESQTAEEGFLSKPSGKDFDYAGPLLTDPATLGEGVGLGMRKDDGELRKRIDTAIASLKKDGTFSKIAAKYFKHDIISK